MASITDGNAKEYKTMKKYDMDLETAVKKWIEGNYQTLIPGTERSP